MSTEMVTADGEVVAAPLVLARDDAFCREMEPHTLDQLTKLAVQLAKIRLCRCETPEEALVRMLTGRELGLTCMQAFRGVHVIDGTPSLSAALKEAICISRKDICEQFECTFTDATKATYRVKRRGQEAKDFTYTLDEAKASGLLDRGSDPKKNNWNRFPKRMLRARAASDAADTVFRDVLLGLASREDLEDGVIDVTQVSGYAPRDSAPKPAPVDKPARDVDGELQALKNEIAAAQTKEAQVAVARKIEAFANDVGPPFGDEAKTFFNTCWRPHKSPNSETPPHGSAP